LAQLGHLDQFIAARRSNYKRLRDELQNLEESFLFPEPTAGSEPSWFGFLLTVRESAPFTRDEIVRHLNEKKIATRLLFGGNLIRQPYMQGRRYRVHGSLANSDRIMNQTFWIGLYPGLSNAHLDYACETIRAYCRGR
jgi:CDP-6-deoxy-D-xylo-4-hexulose-3-dehydrase